MIMKTQTREKLIKQINKWNEARLELFHISLPDKHNEFNGVVRFFFQGDDQRYQSKCVQISSTATAQQLVDVLNEKFHPDLKRLTTGRYAIYEYTPSRGERRLKADDAPLLLQLDWNVDNREGRFLLRDESKPLPKAKTDKTLESQISTLISKANSDNPNQNGSSRRWGTGPRTKDKKPLQPDPDQKGQSRDLNDSALNRTLSNPDHVAQRRREQKQGARQSSQSRYDSHPRQSKNNLVKIFGGDSLNNPTPFVTLDLVSSDTADQVLRWAFDEYGVTNQVNAREFCLVQLNVPHRGQQLPPNIEREVTLTPRDCPISLRDQTVAASQGHVNCVLQIRHRRHAPPPPSKAHRQLTGGEQHHRRSRSVGHLGDDDGKAAVGSNPINSPCLVQLREEGPLMRRNNSTDTSPLLIFSLTDLFLRPSTALIKLGTIDKMVGPPPNIIIDKNSYPDIRPIHCTFSCVLTTATTDQFQTLVKAMSGSEFSRLGQYALLVSPSHDSLTRPPGPASIKIDGQKISGPMIIPNNSIIQLGKSLKLQFHLTGVDRESLEKSSQPTTPGSLGVESDNDESREQAKGRKSVTRFDREASQGNIRIITPYVYWLANASELLNFFKHDKSLITTSRPSTTDEGNSSTLLVGREAVNLLADSVDHCFTKLVIVMSDLVDPLLTGGSWIEKLDEDLQDDVKQDDKPISQSGYQQCCRKVTSIQPMIQLFSMLMQHLRRCRVNASLTIQLFSHLFHRVNTYLFNQVLLTATDSLNARRSSRSKNFWLTHIGAVKLLRRLDRLHEWGFRHGLERAADCRLQKCNQACQLILVDRSNLDSLYDFCMDLLSLNSMQLEWFLKHAGEPPPIPDEWIKLIVTGGKEVNDRACLDELHHYVESGQADIPVIELQLTEPEELPFPLLLPPDGFASDAVLTGAPSGLVEFLRPLLDKKLIHLRRGHTDQSVKRPWTRYLRSNKSTDKLGETIRAKSQSIDRTGSQLVNGRYQPTKTDHQSATATNNKEASKSHSVENDASDGDSEDDVYNFCIELAKEANLPVDSVSRVMLKKLNKSLGLSIVAREPNGIFIKQIIPGGSADANGRLHKGDQLLAIGSTSLIGCAQSNAVATLAQQSQLDSTVEFIVGHGAARLFGIDELVEPVNNFDLEPSRSTSANNSKDLSNRREKGKIRQDRPSPNKARQLTSNAKKKQEQSGSLSRSTPSVNLTAIGDGKVRSRNDSESSSSSTSGEAGARYHPRSQHKSGHDTYESSDNKHQGQKHQQKSNATPTKEQRSRSLNNRQANSTSRLSRRQQGYTDDGDESVTSSSGSDIVQDNLPTKPNLSNQQLATTDKHRRPVEKISSGQQKLTSSKSQPDMLVAVKPIDKQTGGHASASLGATNEDRGDDSYASDAFSSLGSVSSSDHAQFSLHESPVRHLRRIDTDDPVSAVSSSGSVASRTRHPPPPSRPQKAPIRSGQYVNGSSPHLGSPEGAQGSVQKARSVDHLSQKPMGALYNGASAVLTDKQREDDDVTLRQMPGSPTPKTSRSITPTSFDTMVVMGDSHSVQPETKPFPTSTNSQAGTRDSISEQSSAPSELLRPPSSAVVPTNRWAVESTATTLLPHKAGDLPVMRKDPSLGRPTSSITDLRDSSLLVDNQSIATRTSQDHSTRLEPASFNSRQHLLDSSRLVLQPRVGDSGTVSSAITSHYRYQPRPLEELRSPSPMPLSASPTMSSMRFSGNTLQSGTFSDDKPDIRYLPPPPPVPTADHPHYHPPKRLEPVDWTNKQNIQLERSPQTVTKSLTSGTSLTGVEEKYQHNLSNNTSVGKPANLPISGSPFPTSPAQDRIAKLGQEVSQLEAELSRYQRHGLLADEIASTIDRLKIELRFQQGLASRELQRQTSCDGIGSIRASTPSYTSTIIVSHNGDQRRPQKQQTTTEQVESTSSPSTAPIETTAYSDNQSMKYFWNQKRMQAEQELIQSENRRLAQLEHDHKKLYARQEQQARERLQWFERQKELIETRRRAQSVSSVEELNKRKGNAARSMLTDGPIHPASSAVANSHETSAFDSKYGRPRFDTSASFDKPPIPSGSLEPNASLNANERVKKSVSFDRNLETISIYETADAFESVKPANHEYSRHSHQEVQRNQQLPTTSTYNQINPQQSFRPHPPPSVAPKPTQTSSVRLPKSFSTDFAHSSEDKEKTTGNPVPNAELLSFKEKMRLFAGQLGEELPRKQTIKASSKQIELQQTFSTPSGHPTK